MKNSKRNKDFEKSIYYMDVGNLIVKVDPFSLPKKFINIFLLLSSNISLDIYKTKADPPVSISHKPGLDYFE
jgi:hypothetical protein